MADGTEIGRVYIKVRPDSKGFRRELEKDIKRETAGLDAEVEVKPDADGFREKVKASTSNLPDSKVKVGLELDKNLAARFQRNMRERFREMDRIAQIEAQALKSRFENDLFTRPLRQDLEKLQRMTAELRRDSLKMRLEVEPDYSRFHPAAIRNRIASMFGRQRVKVPVDVDVDSKGLSKATSKLSGLMPSFGSGINPAGYVAILGGITLLMAPLMGLITTALLAIPGIIALIATPIAAITLGLDGFKKAAESIKEPFDALRASISASVEKQFLPVFENLAKTFPLLERSMPSVTQGLADMANSVLDFINNGEGGGRIERTIGNIGSALSQASPGVRDFADGFTMLAEQFSLELPDLAGWFNKVAAGFKDWITELTNTGDLAGAFDVLGDVLDRILSTLGQLSLDGMEFISDPGAVDGFVNSLQGLLEGIKEISSVSKELGEVWDGLYNTGRAIGFIGNLLKGDGVEFGNIIDNLNPFDDKPADWSWDNILNIPGLKDTADGAGKEFSGALLKGVQAGAAIGAPGFGQEVAQEITAAVQAAGQDTNLLDQLTAGGVDQSVAQQLTEKITAAIDGAKQAMQSLGPGLQTEIDNALTPLGDLAGKVQAAFDGVELAVSTSLGELPAIVRAAFFPLPNILAETFGPMAETVRTSLDSVRLNAIGTFAFMQMSIATQATNIQTSIRTAFEGIPATITTALGAAVQAAATGASQISVGFAVGLQNMNQVAVSIFASLVETVRGSMSGIVAAVTEAGAQIQAAISSWSGMIAAAGAEMAGVARTAGVAVGAAFAQGISSMTGVVQASAAGLMQAARALFPNSPAKEGPFSGSGWVDKSGESIGIGFAQGLDSSAGKVVDVATELMHRVKEIFGDASGLTLNFNFGGGTGSASPVSQLSGLSSSAKQFETSMANAANPVKQLNMESKEQIKVLSQQLDLLEMRRKELELQRSVSGANNDAIKAELEMIKQKKLELGLQKDQLQYAQKYEGTVSDTADSYNQQFMDMAKVPWDFAQATGNQFMQDFGIGGGAITAGLQAGLDYGSQFIFNVSNIDEAMSVKDREGTKQSLAAVGRV